MPNGQTYRLKFRHVGQVEGYLGQGQMSKVMVIGSKNWAVSLSSESLGPAKEETDDVGCSQCMCFFFVFLIIKCIL